MFQRLVKSEEEEGKRKQVKTLNGRSYRKQCDSSDEFFSPTQSTTVDEHSDHLTRVTNQPFDQCQPISIAITVYILW